MQRARIVRWVSVAVTLVLLGLVIVSALLKSSAGADLSFSGEVTAAAFADDINVTADNAGNLVARNDADEVRFTVQLPAAARYAMIRGERLYLGLDNVDAMGTQVQIRSLADGSLIETLQTVDPIRSMAISPDGELVAVGTNFSLRNNLRIFRGGSRVDIGLSAIPISVATNGEDIVAGFGNSEIVTVENGSIRSYGKTDYQLISIALKDKNLVAFDYYGNLYRGNLAEGTLSFERKIASDFADVWCATENSLIGSTGKGEITIVSIDTGEVTGTVKSYEYASGIFASEERLLVVQDYHNFELFDMAQLGLTSIFRAMFVPVLVIFILALLLTVLQFFCIREGFRAQFTAKLRYVGGQLWKSKTSYLLLLPITGLLAVFCFFPAIWSFLLAFSDYVPSVRNRFVGLDNFAAMFHNQYFWTGIGNMFLFLVTDILKAIIPTVLMAEFMLAMKNKHVQYGVRVLMFIPTVVPGVANILMWVSGIFGDYGVINMTLESLGLESLTQHWLTDSDTALGALIFFGFPWVANYLIFFGALNNIPPSYYEAAELDGCTWWKRIVMIDVPMIAAQIKYIFVTTFIASIQDFNRVWLTTQGGPNNSTYIPALELYQNIRMSHFGEASAMGLFLFIFIFGATIFNLRIKVNTEVV